MAAMSITKDEARAKFRAKNAARKANKASGNRYVREERRHVTATHLDRNRVPCRGAFGNSSVEDWNALIAGTSGTPREKVREDK